ncbi:ABC transporter substrate-binding protein [Mannheimia sp. AT1]|uniref:ABC transporter substrate-binding protein n=1 Tax=Mannheimia cairinae TaxID=3025936 RepID=A0ABT5MMF1_9PAST|nr:ABC transporter substrate-binding protein [Mannheimia cairinae]MDD0823360.1 ABC transporter substrate-binding protein [Mannheimia cairinae]MDD0827032.1 ABC transporter substrate-binding protein [Mannheimia cairinae]
MKLHRTLTAIATLLVAQSTMAKEKISLMLDWFVNPDHAAIIVAQQKGYFAEQGLEVEIIEPADPSMPPKLVAAGKADLAVDYQPQLQQQASQGLPLMRIGTLIATPLNSLVVLENSKINSIADLKGKKIGYSVSGFEDALLKAMLSSAQLTEKDVELINVNWSLSPSLLSGQVDAVIGAFRNFELNQLALENHKGKAFFPEEHGVPAYDELIVVAHKDRVNQAKFSAFLTALEQATIYTLNHPNAAWEAFVSYKPKELNNELNRRAWTDTLPRLAHRPRALDSHRYQRMAEFLKNQGLVKDMPNVEEYATELK